MVRIFGKKLRKKLSESVDQKSSRQEIRRCPSDGRIRTMSSYPRATTYYDLSRGFTDDMGDCVAAAPAVVVVSLRLKERTTTIALWALVLGLLDEGDNMQ